MDDRHSSERRPTVEPAPPPLEVGDEGIRDVPSERRPTAEPAPPRHFGDEEISDILRRAADLQERSVQLVDGRSGGLTLEDIRQVAREAGIDPRFVDIAVANANAPVETRENKLLGGPTQWRFRTVLDGEIDDRDREEIVVEIRSVMGHAGALDDVYGRMEWTYEDGLGPVMIGITSRDGQTIVDMAARRSGEPALYFGLGVPLGGIGGGAILAGITGLTGLAALPLVAGFGLVSYGVARAGWRFRSRTHERIYTDLVERIAMIVQRRARLAPGPDTE